jgi:hypothetical protein
VALEGPVRFGLAPSFTLARLSPIREARAYRIVVILKYRFFPNYCPDNDGKRYASLNLTNLRGGC